MKVISKQQLQLTNSKNLNLWKIWEYICKESKILKSQSAKRNTNISIEC